MSELFIVVVVVVVEGLVEWMCRLPCFSIVVEMSLRPFLSVDGKKERALSRQSCLHGRQLCFGCMTNIWRWREGSLFVAILCVVHIGGGQKKMRSIGWVVQIL